MIEAAEATEPVKSTHRLEVVRVHLEPCPNADSLSLVRLWGYQVLVRTVDWTEGQLGAYVVPDSLVPCRPPFEFLWKPDDSTPASERAPQRIRVKRFRGVLSQGLLVPAPEGSAEGDDVAERLGVTRYEPYVKGPAGTPRSTERGPSAEVGPPPAGLHPVYDLESWHRYAREVLVEDEDVLVTEKIHGSNARFVFQDGGLWFGSRNEWKDPAKPSLVRRAVNACPWLLEWCARHPETTVYGEVYGCTDLKYGRSEVDVLVFDLLQQGRFLDGSRARAVGSGLRWVPLLYSGPYREATIRALADGPSAVAGAEHCREGIVVRPLVERAHSKCGRVALKLVSDAYLERAR